jgi:hypothetical protein
MLDVSRQFTIVILLSFIPLYLNEKAKLLPLFIKKKTYWYARGSFAET